MDPSLLIAIRLSKEGFGSPVAVLRSPVDVVLGAMEFCNFQADFEEAMAEMNNQGTK